MSKKEKCSVFIWHDFSLVVYLFTYLPTINASNYEGISGRYVISSLHNNER